MGIFSMKTPEDEAFEDIERRQGGFQAKRKMAADKQAETVGSLAPTRLWLDFGFDPSEELDGATLEDLDDETTVSYGKPTEHGIEYVRADLVSPPQRQPLTDEQVKQIELSLRQYNSRDTYDLSLNDFARAIEAACTKGEA